MTLPVILSARWEMVQADRIAGNQDVEARDFREVASTMIGANPPPTMSSPPIIPMGVSFSPQTSRPHRMATGHSQ